MHYMEQSTWSNYFRTDFFPFSYQPIISEIQLLALFQMALCTFLELSLVPNVIFVEWK